MNVSDVQIEKSNLQLSHCTILALLVFWHVEAFVINKLNLCNRYTKNTLHKVKENNSQLEITVI